MDGILTEALKLFYNCCYVKAFVFLETKEINIWVSSTDTELKFYNLVVSVLVQIKKFYKQGKRDWSVTKANTGLKLVINSEIPILKAWLYMSSTCTWHNTH